MDVPGNYVRWAKPSLAGLNERLVNHAQIHLVARSLVEQSDYSEESLNLILQWLQAGKTLHVHLANKLEGKPKAQAPLTLYRHLHPYVQEGRLLLYQIPDGTGIDWSQLPRIFVGCDTGLPIIRQHFAVQSLLEGLIVAPADIGSIDSTLSTELNRLLSLSILLPNDVLREGERMSMWELHAGSKRDLADIFSAVAGSWIKELVIRDPYCGARPHREKLTSFLTAIKSLANEIQHVAIHCKEHRDKDGDVEFYLDVERDIDDILVSLGLANRDVEVRPLKGGGRTFHDREVDITSVTDDGCETTHRFFLTGGIDHHPRRS